jgi:hypothetical protein
MYHLLKTIRNCLQKPLGSIDISDMGDSHYKVSTRGARSNKKLKRTNFVGSASQLVRQTSGVLINF